MDKIPLQKRLFIPMHTNTESEVVITEKNADPEYAIAQATAEDPCSTIFEISFNAVSSDRVSISLHGYASKTDAYSGSNYNVRVSCYEDLENARAQVKSLKEKNTVPLDDLYCSKSTAQILVVKVTDDEEETNKHITIPLSS